MRCPACTIGTCTDSGCHTFCNKCNFMAVSINTDYIAACGLYLGAVFSNTRFNTFKDCTQAIYDSIDLHLPLLSQGLKNVIHNKAAVVSTILELAVTNAVNLVIVEDDEAEKPVEPVAEMHLRGFKCLNCHSNEYHTFNNALIYCGKCLTLYNTNEDGTVELFDRPLQEPKRRKKE